MLDCKIPFREHMEINVGTEKYTIDREMETERQIQSLIERQREE